MAVITTMGVIIAALITSGHLKRTSAERREDVLEAQVKMLKTQVVDLEARLAKCSARGDISARHREPSVGTVPNDAAQLDLTGLANRLAREKNTDVLTSDKSAKGVIAKDATKEYVFIGNGNVPLLFALAQPGNNFWSEIDILNSQGAPVMRREGFDDDNDQFTFTPPKDDAYVLRLHGTRKFGDFVIAVSPLGSSK